MTVTEEKGAVIAAGIDELDLEKTFECGQCFRWVRNLDGSFTGVAGSRALRIVKNDGSFNLHCSREDFESYWKAYFDIETDYGAIRDKVGVCEFMKRASEFGQGIRILRQDRWEALCSFIISQCNNIKRIKGIIESLAMLFGEEFSYEGRNFYSFPTAHRLAGLSIEDLEPLRCGYRAKYILSAADSVASGRFDLDEIDRLDTDAAIKKLMELEGVGVKVASCAVLFGYHRLDAFPVDVWMKRAITNYLPSDFTKESFGSYAGVAQQYIFHYTRNGLQDAVNTA